MSWRDAAARALAGIRAFHGSPHDFDRFDISKIGTGEGAQSYGRGLYFAEREGVARSYRDALQSTVRPHMTYGGDRITPSMVQGMRSSADPAEQLLAREYGKTLLSQGKGSLDSFYGDLQRATEQRDMWLKRKADWEANPPVASTYTPKDYETFAGGQQKRIDTLNSVLGRLGLNPGGPTGKMYEVNIGAEPSQFLNWDRPLREQPAGIQALAAASPRLGGNDVVKGQLSEPTGQAIYQRLQNMKGDAAPKVLQDYDVPGVTYYDQMSRNMDRQRADLMRDLDWAHANLTVTQPEAVANLQRQIDALQPTSNYVVFNPDSPLSPVDIVRKYGIAGAPAGALGMGALADQSQYEAPQ